MNIAASLTQVGTLQRNAQARTSSGAYPDTWATVKTGVAARIAQGRPRRTEYGYQDLSEVEPRILFKPDEDVREGDRYVVTGGIPSQRTGEIWSLHGPALPSVPIYLATTGRRVVVAI